MTDDIKAISHEEPRQYFFDSLSTFRKKMGDRDFWKDEKAKDIAVEALTQDYFRTNHGEFLEQDARAFQAAMDEYHRREAYMLGIGFGKRRE